MHRLIVLFLIGIASCSKNGSSSNKFADEVKGSIWTGEIRHDGRSLNEPYSLYFDENGNIEWNEWNGTLTGTYTVNNETRSINVSFAGGESFSVTVSEDDKLTDFEYAGTYAYNIVSGKLYAEGEVELTGTWPSGMESNGNMSLLVTGLRKYKYKKIAAGNRAE